MKLSELLREEHILVDLQAKDKWEAMEKLLEGPVAQGRIRADLRLTVYDALVAREKIASTGMEFGVAIPHASVEGLEDAVAAFGLSPKGVPFQSADGQPARLILLLAIPRKKVPQHIRTLAAIARLLNYEETRDALLQARTAREVLKVVREEEQREFA